MNKSGSSFTGRGVHAAAEANALVAREGIPFREAYRRVGQNLRKD